MAYFHCTTYSEVIHRGSYRHCTKVLLWHILTVLIVVFTNMKHYIHRTSIIGAGGKVTGRMPRDTIKKVRVNRSAIHIETRKGKHGIYAYVRPLSFLWVR
jgi:hypothetical protein